MLKIDIEINLANEFIRSLKLPARALISFNHKSNKSFCFFISYYGFKKMIVKNHYWGLLIGKLFDYSSQAKQFTLLDFTYIYY